MQLYALMEDRKGSAIPFRHIRLNLHSNALRVYLVVLLLRLLRRDWLNHVFHLQDKITAKSRQNHGNITAIPNQCGNTNKHSNSSVNADDDLHANAYSLHYIVW
jgi:hypothetical protein